MAVHICPWCQSEIMHEDGEELERYCPVCDNELEGYRTVGLTLGDDEEEEEAALDDALDADLSWDDRESVHKEKNEALLQYEEAVERLLDEQDLVPECPHCREYMLETGEQRIEAGQFQARVVDGIPLMQAPIAMTTYVCPACFATQSFVAESDRHALAERLSELGKEKL